MGWCVGPATGTFNPQTKINYEIPHGAEVQIKIFDTPGWLVRSLTDGWQEEPRVYDVVWNGKENAGRAVVRGGCTCSV